VRRDRADSVRALTPVTGQACAADVRISLLGGFSVRVAGQPVTRSWRLNKAKTLVKVLALAPDHRLHRDRVVHFLWPDVGARVAANNLHQVLHAVRGALGPPAIELHDEMVQLGPPGRLAVDVDGFEGCAAQARASADLDLLHAALRLWTGPLLPEDVDAGWAIEHRERLSDLHAAVVRQLGSTLFEAGQAEAALAQVEPLAATRPLDEQLHRLLIELLVGCGRRWEAIEVYERLRHALDEAYAADPEPPTRALYRRLLTGGNSNPTAGPHNLPEASTSFVGRRRLLAELSRNMERTRLLSLTGVGGVGKSRLAIELARLVGGRPELTDGVWLVELAGIQDPEVVPSAVAAALRITLPNGSSPVAGLVEQLAGRSLLLLLDNCEHLLETVGGLVSRLLARCPDVLILATSREPLALPAELAYRVPSLELPTSAAPTDLRELSGLEAVQLFVERAWLAMPSFRLNSRTAGPVARICRQLDGIPLALELAAARLAHLTVDELADGLAEALTLLERPGHGRLDRQQTLSMTLDWSHGLLLRDERMVFRRLAVFAGGFDIAAAAAVCDLPERATTATVSRLVDKSLVQADVTGLTTRYRLLDVVRQYAASRLGDSAELVTCRRRHLRWFADAAQARDPGRGAAAVGQPSGWFDLEQDNLHAALSAALATDPVIALRLATTMWRFWADRGLTAGGAWWLDRALGACSKRSSLRAGALSARAMLVRQGRSDELAGLGPEIVELLDEFGAPDERAYAHHHRALLAYMAGDWRHAEDRNRETLRHGAGFPAVSASAHHFAGVLALGRGQTGAAHAEFDAALRFLDLVPDDAAPFFVAMSIGWVVDERHPPPLPFGEDTVLLRRRVGRRQAIGYLRIALALTERLVGQEQRALSILDEAAILFDSLSDRHGQACALAQQGHTLRWAGRYAEADQFLERSESLRRELRDRPAVAMSLSGRSLIAAAAGNADRARSFGQESLAMMERSEDTAGFTVAAVNLGVTELLSGDMSASLGWLDRSLAQHPIPGGHRSLGWLHLLRAHDLSNLGAPEDAAAAIADARAIFAALGEASGLVATQRMCKVADRKLGAVLHG
jgi:predicted ATPase/DNA-binding SARP family transcriptional activator